MTHANCKIAFATVTIGVGWCMITHISTFDIPRISNSSHIVISPNCMFFASIAFI